MKTSGNNCVTLPYYPYFFLFYIIILPPRVFLSLDPFNVYLCCGRFPYTCCYLYSYQALFLVASLPLGIMCIFTFKHYVQFRHLTKALQADLFVRVFQKTPTDFNMSSHRNLRVFFILSVHSGINFRLMLSIYLPILTKCMLMSGLT